ncbi:MAG: MarC family protein [Crocinitomicaceae bacterium]|jgi:multiple antibiotic resistance protein|nr:MarC family protein [Crocinitomicaceae bacterium]MDC1195820.1 MarC family protein [Crocinitomicaceae bacterium]|tara:strand:+ start:1589 stop:2179 length:591 start_codon:yes stop_codon:yes gene_type:complete
MSTFFYAFNWVELFKATMVLFAVVDIVGSIPIIIKLKEQSGEIHALRTSLVSLVIMISFLILGESILSLFGVNVQSFAVAGSIILFAMALEMIMGVRLFRDEVSGKTASIVPLAFPIIAGAGSMTSIISLRAEYDEINIMIAIFINILIVFIVLKTTRIIEKVLGEGGIAILKKVFGIILLAIAIRLFTENVKELF